MRTSHVGSFPLPNNVENIEKVLMDLCSTGIDAPPYPQFRSFIDIYLEPLRDLGVLTRRNDFYFLTDPDKLEELYNYKPVVPEAEYTMEYVRRKRLGFRWLRAPVTGVYTLASRIYVESSIEKGLNATLLRDKKLLDPLITYVRRHLEYMARLGYNVLFIDEPVLGVIVGRRRILFNYTREDIIDTIDKLYEGLPGEHGIHVCGRISPLLYELLVDIDNLDIVNFEFHDSRRNLEVINGELLASTDKKLAPGIASSKKPVVEPVEELVDLLSQIGEKTNWRIDLVSADCGFGGLATESGDPWEAYRIGLAKLRNIVKAVKQVKEQTR